MHEPIELAVRFHRRLVVIHPFPNGNGRLSRMVADLSLHYRKLPMLPWGRELGNNSSGRGEYLVALREADQGRLGRLLEFAKSGKQQSATDALLNAQETMA